MEGTVLRAVRRRFAPAAVLGVVLLLLGGRWDAAGSMMNKAKAVG